MKGINAQKHAWLNEVPIQMGTCSSKAQFSHVLCQCHKLHPWFSNTCGSTSSQEKTVICPPNHSFVRYLKLLLLVMYYRLVQSMESRWHMPMLQTEWKSTQGLQTNGNSKMLFNVSTATLSQDCSYTPAKRDIVQTRGQQTMYPRVRDPTDL